MTAMRSVIKYKIMLLMFFTTVLVNSCVEPYEFEEVSYTDMLVVEATITDEFKFHKITVTKTIPLSQQVPVPATDADVRITDSSMNEIVFDQKEPGVFVSRQKFAAQPGVNYTLEISTEQGRFISQPQQLVSGSQIDDLDAIRTVNSKGTDGIALILDSKGNSSYYRYQFEETYKIVSNYAVATDLVIRVNEEDEVSIVQVPKTKEEYICYNTEVSDGIILSSTNSLSDNILEDFLVNFIETGNPKISHRYSILVKQYAISNEAYAFYRTIKDLSISESIFSQSQPGFVNGNIHPAGDSGEKVIGFFSVSSVDTERIFFDYEDYYDKFYNRPSFATNCSPIRPSVRSIMRFIGDENFSFLRASPPPPADYVFPPSNYLFVPAGCVDCTVYGTNVAPEFWVEE